MRPLITATCVESPSTKSLRQVCIASHLKLVDLAFIDQWQTLNDPETTSLQVALPVEVDIIFQARGSSCSQSVLRRAEANLIKQRRLVFFQRLDLFGALNNDEFK